MKATADVCFYEFKYIGEIWYGKSSWRDLPPEHYNKDYFDLPDTQAIDYLSMKTNLAGSEMAPLTEAFQYEPHTNTLQCAVGLPRQV